MKQETQNFINDILGRFDAKALRLDEVVFNINHRSRVVGDVECFCGFEDSDQKWYLDIVEGEDNVVRRIEVTEEQAADLCENHDVTPF